jgi:GAF domain-containing protein
VNRETELSRAFVELADTLVADFDVVDFLHTLTLRCVDLFDVDAAGLMLADSRDELRLVAASAEQVELLELLELQSEEGPCLDSYRTGVAVSSADLSETDAWPRFRQAVLASGFRAVQALPLRLRGQVIGALNLFRVEPGVLSSSDLAVCQAIADVATIGLLQARAVREAQLLADQLSTALRSRVVIEQAKGVLAERSNVDMDTAFRVLRTYARRHNLRLADLATDVVERRLDLSQIDSTEKR